jgi:hypothetical protein
MRPERGAFNSISKRKFGASSDGYGLTYPFKLGEVEVSFDRCVFVRV